jgi:proteasome lid subunit RPN8/RPN11
MKMSLKQQTYRRRPLREDDWLDDESYGFTQPVLRFSPTAWAKLLYLRDTSGNEVGGFGITRLDDLLFVEDFVTVKQEVSSVSVRFGDESVSQFFDQQVDLGRKPEQFARIWLHTHPGNSPEPSSMDEDTFKRVFGNCQWSVMAIVAQDNSTYARLSFNIGPGGDLLIPTAVDYGLDFGPSDHGNWDVEYKANVREESLLAPRLPTGQNAPPPATADPDGSALSYDFMEQFENMDPVQRQIILDELADRPELWDQESEVIVL